MSTREECLYLKKAVIIFIAIFLLFMLVGLVVSKLLGTTYVDLIPELPIVAVVGGLFAAWRGSGYK